MTKAPGCPEAELEQIFEAFVQSSKTKDGSGGTGLGLAICRKIIEAMGGQIFAGATSRPKGPRSISCCRHAVLQRPSRLLCECIRGAVSATVSWGEKSQPIGWLFVFA